MIVSPNKKFVFVHNPKTAGTSIEQVLEPYSNYYNRSVLEILRFRLNKYGILKNWKYMHYHKHLRADEALEFISRESWNSMFTFGFVRNPFDRQVSIYLYKKRTNTVMSHDLIAKLKDFKAYVHALVNEPELQRNRYVYQKNYFTDNNNNQIVNFVGKYENLSKDIDKISKAIGIKIDLPWELKSNRMHYREYYDEETRKIMEEYVKPDLDAYDYDF